MIDQFSCHCLLLSHYQIGDSDQIHAECWYPAECSYLKDHVTGWKTEGTPRFEQADIDNVERVLLAMATAAPQHYRAIKRYYKQGRGRGHKPLTALRNFAVMWTQPGEMSMCRQAE